MEAVVFTFDTTHHALWAEEIARDESIAHEVTPAPAEANARCSIALQILSEDEARLASALDAVSLPFRIHQPGPR